MGLGRFPGGAGPPLQSSGGGGKGPAVPPCIRVWVHGIKKEKMFEIFLNSKAANYNGVEIIVSFKSNKGNFEDTCNIFWKMFSTCSKSLIVF